MGTLRNVTEAAAGDPPLPRVLAVGCGDLHAEALVAAGYEVDRQPCIDYTRLERADLLLLAPAPPEPAAHELVRQLSGCSATPVVALVEHETATEHTAVIDAGAADCLDAATDDAELLAHLDSLLASRVGSASEPSIGGATARCPGGTSTG
jgi:DNA-binding response OmpR family regulator